MRALLPFGLPSRLRVLALTLTLTLTPILGLAALGAARAGAAGQLEVALADSVFAVITHRAGFAAALAHDHFVVAAEPAIELGFDPAAPLDTTFELALEVSELVTDDPEQGKLWAPRLLELGVVDRPFEEIKESNRQKVREAMLGKKQLEAERFPAMSARLVKVTEDDRTLSAVEFPYTVELELTIHGVTRLASAAARFEARPDGYLLEAVAPLRFTDFGIEPYSAALGAVKNQDDFHVYVNAALRQLD